MKELIIEKAEIGKQNKYKNITVRISKEYLEQLDLLVKETNHSRSALISKFIKFGLDNYQVR